MVLYDHLFVFNRLLVSFKKQLNLVIVGNQDAVSYSYIRFFLNLEYNLYV